MRPWTGLLLVLAGCASAHLDPSGDAGDALPAADAAQGGDGRPPRDLPRFLPPDAALADATRSGADANPPDASRPDGAAPRPPDAAPPPAPDARVACERPCRAVECGPIPDGCGGIVDCGDCGHGTDVCIREGEGRFVIRVRNAVAAVKAEHPEYFDFTQGSGDSVLVVDDANYGPAVVAHVNARGSLVAQVDPNDPHEIRVRDEADAADNYLIRTHANNYTSNRYTSTCRPAGF